MVESIKNTDYVSVHYVVIFRRFQFHTEHAAMQSNGKVLLHFASYLRYKQKTLQIAFCHHQ
jgi:hypothetical protein